MKLQEMDIITFGKKIASDGGADKFYDGVKAHGIGIAMAGTKGSPTQWKKVLGILKSKTRPENQAVFAQIVSFVKNSLAGAYDDFDSKQNAVMYWKNKGLGPISESSNLFSDDGPYRLKESYSSYLQKLV